MTSLISELKDLPPLKIMIMEYSELRKGCKDVIIKNQKSSLSKDGKLHGWLLEKNRAFCAVALIAGSCLRIALFHKSQIEEQKA